MRKILERFCLWRRRRLYRRVARLMRPYLDQTEPGLFSLDIAVTPIIPEPSIEEVEQGALTHTPMEGK